MPDFPCPAFELLDPFDKIALAVSGGSDSLALLFLFHDWGRVRKKKIVVFTVDHKLRHESSDEARHVARLCADLNLAHETLRWEGEKPENGLPSAAREARYRLLSEACNRHDSQALALGHTHDDQAETVSMRLSRAGADSRGLAGMAQTTLYCPYPGCKTVLLRPLLRIKRATLRAYLKAREVSWIDDPGNINLAYERVRTRERLAQSGKLRDDLVNYAGLISRSRYQLSSEAARLIESTCKGDVFARLFIDCNVFDGASKPARLLAMQVLLSVIGGRDYLPALEKASSALSNERGATLSRVHISRTKNGIFLTREDRGLPQNLMLGEEFILWDHRFWLRKKPETGVNIHVMPGKEIPEVISYQFQNITPAEKKACGAMPFIKVVTNGNKMVFPVFSAMTHNNWVECYPSSGALERFCSGPDQQIRAVVKSLFT